MSTETLADFPARASDKLRYGDTDAQGHVNNAVFSTFLETARTELLYAAAEGDEAILDRGCGFVIVRLELDYVAEVLWPGSVDMGTRVVKVGSSSVTLDQTVFQADKVVARARSVMVQVNLASRKPQALSERAKARLEALI